MNAFWEFVFLFLLVSLVVSVVCSIRASDWPTLVRDATHFFVMLVAGIFLFSLVVYLLEWAFIRRL